MANTPTPRSYNQILGDEINALLSRLGLNSLKVGGPILSILEATAQSQLRTSSDIFQLLRSNSLDNAQGPALDNIGLSELLPRLTQRPASGVVTISDTSFAKISTKVFQGTAAPIVGSTVINVVDALDFIAGGFTTGNIYIGRGTSNYEGPLAYTSILPPGVGMGFSGGSYYSFVLSSGTQRFHNQNETVVLAQGGVRSVPSGTIVQTPQGPVVNAIQFKTLFDVFIPDGETTVENVQVVAQKPGISGNVPAKAIKQFSVDPFSSASVTNPTSFTNGQATESDDAYRERIRNVRQTRQLGTVLALTTNSVGVTAFDENKRVLSASVVTRTNEPAVLYVDDGTGYEELNEGVAIETIVAYALGGEQYLKVAQSPPVAKAYLESSITAPFALISGAQLAVNVGGKVTSNTFDSDEFINISNASAYEVVASINANPDLDWSARTSDSGQRVVIFAKSDTEEDVKISTPNGIDANDYLGFPVRRDYTMTLYKNDRLLTKDGSLATVRSTTSSNWDALVSPQSLILDVDGITLSFDGTQFDEFTDQDFIDADTGFTTLGTNTPEAWAKVFEFRIPGISATVEDGVVALTSNRGRSDTASVGIVSGTLVTNSMFTVQSSAGSTSDYTLDRNNGQIKLKRPLVEGDTLTAGNLNTRAFLESGSLGAFNIAVNPAKLWFAVDGRAQLIQTALTGATPFNIAASVVEDWGWRQRMTSVTASALFANVQIGDWVTFWDPNITMEGSFRISRKASDSSWVEWDRSNALTGRSDFQAVQMLSGKVLLAGGLTGSQTFGRATNSVEIYDPLFARAIPAAPMNYPRYGYAASVLMDGRVLVAGGFTTVGPSATITDTCELYDEGTDSWTVTDPLSLARAYHTATLLNDGRVMVCGGRTTGGVITATSEIFDPGPETWSAGGAMATARQRHSAVILPTPGTVIVAGGETTGSAVTATAELFTSGPDTFAAAGSMPGGARHSMAATWISPAGTVARFTGGSTAFGAFTPTAVVDNYTSGGGWAAGVSMGAARCQHALVQLSPSNDFLAIGGQQTLPQTQFIEKFAGGVWSFRAQPLSTSGTFGAKRIGVQAVPFFTDDVFIFGGQTGPNVYGNVSQHAASEYFQDGSNSWSVPDAGNGSALTLTNNGIEFSRTTALLQEIEVPIGTNYTATSIVSQLTSQLEGATSQVYRTTALRVRTNTFNDTGDETLNTVAGDIALVAANTNGQLVDLPIEDSTNNITGHSASIESQSSELGTPDFLNSMLIGKLEDALQITRSTNTYFPQLLSSNSLVLLKEKVDLVFATDTPVFRIGTNYGWSTFLEAASDPSGTLDLDTITPRSTPDTDWLARQRLSLRFPYSLSYDDQFMVLVDQDVEKRFTLPMWRKLKPTSTTYASTNAFVDADNGNQSLARGFGYTGGPTPFDFDDFAVYMPSRVLTYSADAARRTLWRYYRLGPDGDNTRLRIGYPDAPDAAVAVSVDNHDSSGRYSNVTVKLAGGAQRTITNLLGSTKIGLAAPSATTGLTTRYYIFGYPCTAQRVANVVTLTLTFPTGVTSTGWIAGNGPFAFVSDSPGVLNSSNFTVVTAVGNTVTYSETAADAGPVTGVAYVGPVAVNLSGSGSTQFDFFRLDTTATTDANYEGFTGRVLNNPATSPYWVETKSEDASPSLSSTVTTYTLGDASAFKIFANPTQTATVIANAVNALAATDPKVPVTATITGTGAGTIGISSSENSGVFPTWFSLTDGINFVQSTTPAVSLVSNYSLSFKNPISAGLATDSDWINETVKVVPKTARNVVDWMSALAVSGLSSVATPEESSRAHKVQLSSLTAGSDGSLQVQGGTANSVTATVVGSSNQYATSMISTIETTDLTGFSSGQWCALDNTNRLPKPIFDATTVLDLIEFAGNESHFVIDSGTTDVFFLGVMADNAVVNIEKQGNFVAYSATVFGDGSFDATSPGEGDYVYIFYPPNPTMSSDYQINNVNTGIFRVIRSTPGVDGTEGTFWIENPNATDQQLAECNIWVIQDGSMLPGDELSNSSNLWNSANKGTRTITRVGEQYCLVPIGGIVRVGVTCTVTTTNPHGFASGNWFDLGPGESLFPAGRYQVATTPTANTFTFSLAGAAGASTVVHTIRGMPFQNASMFDVSNVDDTMAEVNSPAAALGTQYPLVQVIEGKPSRFIKQIAQIVPDQGSETLTEMRFTTEIGYDRISEVAGTVITVLDKLDFPVTLAQGVDGYKHSIGLIGAVNKVIYGDVADPSTYPGVAAAGAVVNIEAALIKRIQVSLALRLRSGAPQDDIKQKAKAAVAAYINSFGVGQSIPIDGILTAVRQVGGILAVTPINPTLSSGNDLISVQPFEKPIVLDVDQDVLISFVGA